MANAGRRGRPIAPLVLSAEERDIWRGKFVVTVSRGRYLNDSASFCDVRTAWQAISTNAVTEKKNVGVVCPHGFEYLHRERDG
jgi:hypothetical protein